MGQSETQIFFSVKPIAQQLSSENTVASDYDTILKSFTPPHMMISSAAFTMNHMIRYSLLSRQRKIVVKYKNTMYIVRGHQGLPFLPS